VNLPLGPKSAPHSGGPADEAYILGRAGTYPKASADCQVFLSEFLNVAFRRFSWTRHAVLMASPHIQARKFTKGDDQ
jgi:hypothetical protein